MISYRRVVSLNLTMPILCSGHLFGSKQQKSFDVVMKERSLVIKGKSGPIKAFAVFFSILFVCLFVCLLVSWGSEPP